MPLLPLLGSAEKHNRIKETGGLCEIQGPPFAFRLFSENQILLLFSDTGLKNHSPLAAALCRNRAPAGAQNKKVRNSSCLSCVYCTGDGYARTVPSCYYSGISFKKMGMPQALQVSG